MDEEIPQPRGDGPALSVDEPLGDEVERLRSEAVRRLADLEARLEKRIDARMSALETSEARARERERRVSELQGALESSGRKLLERVERLRAETTRELHERGDTAAHLEQAIAEAAQRLRTELLAAVTAEGAETHGDDEERAQMAELTLAVRGDAERDRIDRLADRRVAEAQERLFDVEKRFLEAVAESEREAHRRLLEAADAAFQRIASADRAQEREARIRERAVEAERASENRVRDAEKRLLELMERADAAERRLAQLDGPPAGDES
jgi:hypothetical protein